MLMSNTEDYNLLWEYQSHVLLMSLSWQDKHSQCGVTGRIPPTQNIRSSSLSLLAFIVEWVQMHIKTRAPTLCTGLPAGIFFNWKHCELPGQGREFIAAVHSIWVPVEAQHH